MSLRCTLLVLLCLVGPGAGADKKEGAASPGDDATFGGILVEEVWYETLVLQT